MNNKKIKTAHKRTLITVVLNFIAANTCCCTMHQKMARGFKFWIYEVEESHCLCSEKKALISFADRTAKLICTYVLAYAKNRFPHAAQLLINLLANLLQVAVVLMHKK